MNDRCEDRITDLRKNKSPQHLEVRIYILTWAIAGVVEDDAT